MKARLLLEDGTILEGKSFGVNKTVCGEIVFNTGMTGYQEILTDPSYGEQIVVMTYPLIGNYGINSSDRESNSIHVKGFVVREYSEIANNWKNEKSLADYLQEHNIPAISGVDTRMLTKKIRNQGTMRCLFTTEKITEELKLQLEQYAFPTDIVKQVSRKNKLVIPGKNFKIGLIDLGVKTGIVNHLSKLGSEVHLYPWNVESKTLLNSGLDAILLSNGPGDPKEVTEVINTTKELLGKIPLFGICLGHQILSLALGGNTYKLKFGHRGSNHPVIDLRSNKVMITAQNHGYAVYPDSLPNGAKITHLNVNDETVEGFCHTDLNIHTVQFHPEAGPGPTDANCIFSEWLELLNKDHKNA